MRLRANGKYGASAGLHPWNETRISATAGNSAAYCTRHTRLAEYATLFPPCRLNVVTAPHIGVSLRVVVLDLDPVDRARTYVNPEIIWASPETILHQEGSVSMPGVNDEVS